MKKLFLLSVFALVTIAGNAQKVMVSKPHQPTVKAQMPSDLQTAKPLGVEVRKTAETGVWFARPEGALVTGWTHEGSGYYVNSIIVPPFYNVVYKNMSTNPSETYWYLNDNDITEYADEENNLPLGSYGCYDTNYYAEEDYWYVPSYYTPELVGGKLDNFTFGTCNNKYAEGHAAYLRIDTIGYYSFTDEQNASVSYGWGRFVSPTCTNVLFGSGVFTFSDGTQATSMGVVDFFPKPASALYVEHACLSFYTSNTLLKNGAELTMTFYGVKENEEGTTILDTDHVIAQLKCTENDVVNWWGPELSDRMVNGEVYGVDALFHNAVTDEFGTEYDEPFSINEPFAIVVSGFENPDVDANMPAPEEAAEDKQTSGVQALLTDGENVWYQHVYSGGVMALPVRFYGLFDYVEAQDELYSFDEEGNVVETYPGLNVIQVSDDGKSNATKGADEDHNIGAAVFYNNFPWFDGEGLENYYPVEQPDWVVNIEALDVVDSDGDRTGMTYVAFECEPLPAGVKGRKAEIYFQGKGYKSELPIILIQGEVEDETEECVTEINVEREVGQGYGVTSYEPDFTEALAYLGIENPTDATLVGINADGSEEAAPGPGGIDGWCDANGNFIGWGKEDTRICVKFFPSVPQYEICDMNGADEVGKTYTVKYGLKANDKMATFVINVTFVKSQEVELSLSENVIKARVEYESDEVSYVERKVVLTDDQVNEIITDLGLASLADAKVYGWNPTTEEFVKSYAAYDGWRNAQGDFANWTGTAAVPACVKYTDGQTYLCYNIKDCEPQEIKCYWAIANDKRAVLVEITFAYVVPSGINEINADEKADAIFNINGVQIVKPQQKGIYIQNGKKVVIK